MSQRTGTAGFGRRVLGRIDAVLPPGSRVRRVGEWGIVAWAAIGAALIGWMVWLVLHRLAGVLPFLVVAWLVAFILGPAVNGLAALRMPRPLAATGVFLAAATAMPAVVPIVVRTVLAQLKSLLESSPRSLQHGAAVARLSHSSNSVLRSAGHAIHTKRRDKCCPRAGEQATVSYAGPHSTRLCDAGRESTHRAGPADH